MKIVLTMMVRDEIDIIVPMLEHHIDQGIETLIVTDNGSVDGTTEVLEKYADAGYVELHHDPVHRKQQGVVTTAMARRARTEHGADWVINADADEFLVPRVRSRRVADVLAEISLDLISFTVPVVNYVGVPAERGSGVDRLVYRDRRDVEQLKACGIPSQPTPNMIHRGDPSVVVVQGNHFTDLASNGEPPEDLALECLHLPWRSWEQFEQKVRHAGLGYEANPDLRPSPNHHGMMDYRRWQAGRLRHSFVTRMPLEKDLESDPTTYERDPWLADHLHGLVDRAVFPHLLAEAVDSARDEALTREDHETSVVLARQFMDLEGAISERGHRISELEAESDTLRYERDLARREATTAWKQVSTRTQISHAARSVGHALRQRLTR
ncbi:MAG: glycosyltransferase family 2 protein [Aquihabitans sp.]